MTMTAQEYRANERTSMPVLGRVGDQFGKQRGFLRPRRDLGGRRRADREIECVGDDAAHPAAAGVPFLSVMAQRASAPDNGIAGQSPSQARPAFSKFESYQAALSSL